MSPVVVGIPFLDSTRVVSTYLHNWRLGVHNVVADTQTTDLTPVADALIVGYGRVSAPLHGHLGVFESQISTSSRIFVLSTLTI